MKKSLIHIFFTFLITMMISCESESNFPKEDEQSISLSNTDNFSEMKKQMEIFTENSKNNTYPSGKALSGSIPQIQIKYDPNTQNVSGNLILNTTQKPINAKTQWMTFKFTGQNFFGGHPIFPNFAGTHVAIGVLGHASNYISGVGAILGSESRGTDYPTAYYESYWNGGNHLDFMDDDFNPANHSRLFDAQEYSFILHANHNGWVWFRILDQNNNIVIDRVRKYVNPNMDELISSTGIFILGLKNYGFPNNHYQLNLKTINYGWF
ncbi:hypothetical protein [uncultured Aquimarina sp.]|uniref:hypothetical protein n=1 Tax=uncultured Aquimarina sp. TaxID=575652 RepID=UPI002616AF1D|nr:hypothetical protein [uncultured Aquimarina sp.]